MIAFAPIAILYFAALLLVALQRLKPGGVGYAWLSGSLASLAALGMMVYLRWQLPQQVAVANWLPFSQFTDSPIFGLDGSSWPYAFCLTVVTAAIMLSASARLSYRITPWAWVGVLLVAGTAMMAVYAANLLTLALAWTAVDLLDLVILSGYSERRTLGVQAVIAFSLRVTGMVMVILAALINRSQGIPPTFEGLPALSALILLLASGLRLGVLPLNLPALPDLRVRRGLGTMLRMGSAASSLVVLARLPAQPFSPGLANFLVALSVLAVLYAAGMWLGTADEIAARPYWIIALAGMAVICALHGEPHAGMAWGTALLLSGSLIFLYSARMRGTLALPVLGILSLSALPFTPAAVGWVGVLKGDFTFWELLLLLAHLLLILGYLRFAVRKGDALRDMERWVQVIYPFGLGLLGLAPWVVGTIGWAGAFTVGIWWTAPVTGLGLAALGGLWALLGRLELAAPEPLKWYLNAARRTGALISQIFSLGWVYSLLWAVYRRLELAIQILTDILEGAGGVLWVFVLLALFASLLISRLSP